MELAQCAGGNEGRGYRGCASRDAVCLQFVIYIVYGRVELVSLRQRYRPSFLVAGGWSSPYRPRRRRSGLFAQFAHGEWKAVPCFPECRVAIGCRLRVKLCFHLWPVSRDRIYSRLSAGLSSLYGNQFRFAGTERYKYDGGNICNEDIKG